MTSKFNTLKRYEGQNVNEQGSLRKAAKMVLAFERIYPEYIGVYRTQLQSLRRSKRHAAKVAKIAPDASLFDLL